MKLLLPAGNFAAYLFDCDGTLADTMPLHYEAWVATLAAWNCPFPEQLFYEWAGMPPLQVVQALGVKQGLALPAANIVAEKEALYYELLPTIRPIPEVIEHLKKARARNIPCGVVSGSPRDSVLKTLTTLGISDDFATIVAAEDCERGKPDPGPFLLAARRLEVDPKRCLVFEDGNLGIRAAEAAGMRWIRVPKAVD